ncbi:hypothetical protein TREMEDRAFT_65984 [Tremella mesenterica DSM 1558]|uniref:uncharacterized protein n=1 Tax=Tremella mesenterica (strain ATCC 24925 / CBS 8224 / DSM 1558 / NBRC 9311 / NRRL Y-6157 / RJB 2259-6 / UBC 559-6) TaxID=578456 RepID=UPI00032C621F|nr:uncharacterized protein TREMEDRAFT_65984 [Tremella mesenterica DSM 1558]EIW65899.1 hypothetical protein TREMEDRAFT_65984 [Tremella mesenterica DSM 1558]
MTQPIIPLDEVLRQLNAEVAKPRYNYDDMNDVEEHYTQVPSSDTFTPAAFDTPTPHRFHSALIPSPNPFQTSSSYVPLVGVPPARSYTSELVSTDTRVSSSTQRPQRSAQQQLTNMPELSSQWPQVFPNDLAHPMQWREDDGFGADPVTEDNDQYDGDEMWKDEDALAAVDAASKPTQRELSSSPNAADDDEPVATIEVLNRRKAQDKDLKERRREYVTRTGTEKPVTDVPAPHCKLFEFATFNTMQTKVFDSVYNGDDNLVIAAPTSSGKTTVFDLAFLRMMSQETFGMTPMAVYLAPTKALCSERMSDWSRRFQSVQLGWLCNEVTGDTGSYNEITTALRTANLIVTTPEKWDSLTRRRSQSHHLLRRLALVMIDEVHFLHETRGATLEVLVSRIKTRADNVRFIALSATVPNVDDVARWIGAATNTTITTPYLTDRDGDDRDEAPDSATGVEKLSMAKVFKFGEETRPVPLTRHFYGYEGGNEWALSPQLDKSLFPILLKHCDAKPALVFCPTRRSCLTTAQYVHKIYTEARVKYQPLPWRPPGSKLVLKDTQVAALTDCGIAVHHAGLDYTDRRDIENAFKEQKLHLIVCTSTLAVGVNLPAHTVVIKGTQTWQGGATGFKEYSDIEIQQMMGRAGLPREAQLKHRPGELSVRGLSCSWHRAEFYRHQNLTEHINSEIGLGTITDLKTAQDWLKSSFLFIRIQQNPRHYAIPGLKDKDSRTSWEEWLDHYVESALKALEEYDFVTHEDGDDDADYHRPGLSLTAIGRILSENFIAFETMVLIIGMKPRATLRELLEILSSAKEYEDLRIRPGEGQALNKLRTNVELRFTLDEPVKSYADKVFLYFQVCFSNIDLENESGSGNASPHKNLMAIFQHATRITRAIVSVAKEKHYGGACRSALQLLHAVAGKAWENEASMFRQIESIGPKSIKVLRSKGINNFDALIAVNVSELAHFLNRDFQFANAVHVDAECMPRYTAEISTAEVSTEGKYPIVTFRVKILQTSKTPSNNAARGNGRRRYRPPPRHNLSILFLRSDDMWIDLRKALTSKLNDQHRIFTIQATLERPDHKIIAYIGVDEVAGCATRVEYDPKLDADLFPEIETEEESEDEDSDNNHQSIGGSGERKATQAVSQMPCHHRCRNRKVCAHACCKQGVSQLQTDTKRGARRGPPPDTERSPHLSTQEMHAAPLTNKSASPLVPPTDTHDSTVYTNTTASGLSKTKTKQKQSQGNATIATQQNGTKRRKASTAGQEPTEAPQGSSKKPQRHVVSADAAHRFILNPTSSPFSETEEEMISEVELADLSTKKTSRQNGCVQPGPVKRRRLVTVNSDTRGRVTPQSIPHPQVTKERQDLSTSAQAYGAINAQMTDSATLQKTQLTSASPPISPSLSPILNMSLFEPLPPPIPLFPRVSSAAPPSVPQEPIRWWEADDEDDLDHLGSFAVTSEKRNDKGSYPSVTSQPPSHPGERYDRHASGYHLNYRNTPLSTSMGAAIDVKGTCENPVGSFGDNQGQGHVYPVFEDCSPSPCIAPRSDTWSKDAPGGMGWGEADELASEQVQVNGKGGEERDEVEEAFERFMSW